jgi:hypothetical protein
MDGDDIKWSNDLTIHAIIAANNANRGTNEQLSIFIFAGGKFNQSTG